MSPNRMHPAHADIPCYCNGDGDLLVLLWSHQQGSFKVEPLADAMRSGVLGFAMRNHFSDFVALRISNDPRVLAAFQEKLISKFGCPEPLWIKESNERE